MIRVNVHVHPGSRISGAGGSFNGKLNIHVRARAVDGAATQEVLAVLAKAFRVRTSAVQLVRGVKSRQKIVSIEGDDETLMAHLEHLLILGSGESAKG